VISTAFGAGSIVANMIMLRWRPRYALRTAAIALIFASCQAVIIGSGLPLGAIAGIEFLSAIGVSFFFTMWEVSLQEHIPEAAISRVTSYDYASSAGMIPLGVIVAGPVADAVGIHATLAGMSVIGIAAALLCLCVRDVRTLPRGTAHGTAAPAPAGP
jgi:hypothetical protein